MKEEEKINLEEEETLKEEEKNVENSEVTENTEDSEKTEDAAPAEEKDPLEAAKEEIEQLKTQILYKTAEFDNYRKRTLKEKVLREGMELIYHKFMKALEGLGVKKIETENADFDTDLHEAVAMVPGMGDDKKGKVIDCLQTGYQLNEKVIRHAKVAVGQ